jgi:hypothetical protein
MHSSLRHNVNEETYFPSSRINNSDCQQRKKYTKVSWKIFHIKARFKTWRSALYLSQWTLMMECHPYVLSTDQSVWRQKCRKEK